MSRPPFWEKQKFAIREAIRHLSAYGGVGLFMEMGTGKALPDDAPVLTPSGWVPLSTLSVGDQVIGSDGKPTPVLGIYPQGEQAIYRITFSDDSTAECTGDHLWTVNTPLRKWRKMSPLTMPLEKILQGPLTHRNGNRKYYIPMVAPVEFREKAFLLDPYLLGVLLGDGCLRSSSVEVTTADPEIITHLQFRLPEGNTIVFRQRYNYAIVSRGQRNNGVLSALRQLGLTGKRSHEKFIPDDYLRGSVEQRLDLLRGLFDTDGGVSGAAVEYTTTSEALATGVLELVRSLGGTGVCATCYKTYKHKNEQRLGKKTYRLNLKFPEGIQPFRIARKRIASRTKYFPQRAIVSAEIVRRATARCIRVGAEDGLFVTKDYVLTHNTRVSIRVTQKLHNAGGRLGLIVAEISSMYVWVEEWSKWADYPVMFMDLRKTGCEGLRSAQKLADAGFNVICLINYELMWQLGKKRVQRTRHGQKVWRLEAVDTTVDSVLWDWALLDESTNAKTPGSRVGQFCRRLGEKVRWKIILTGSAYKKRPLDVWGQVKIIRPDVFPEPFEQFKAMYSIPHPKIRGAIKGYQNLDHLAKRLSQVAILLKKEDVVDLPPFTHHVRYVDLGEKARSVYERIEAESFAELEAMEEEGKTVTATHVFTRMRKLAQITSGFVKPDIVYPDGYDPDRDPPIPEPEPFALGTEKLDELMRILEDRERPTILVTQFNFEEQVIAAAVKKRFGFDPKILNGSVQGADKRHALLKAASKDLCVIVKESVGARGVDIRYADMTIWFSHGYDTEAYDQMCARNHRGGQTMPITYVHLTARKTIDEKIFKTLNKDLDLAREIERHWKDFLTSRKAKD
jgi:hypothetical protein